MVQRCAPQNARETRCHQKRAAKRPCQPKTAKRIFGGPGSQGPSGQAKERTRVLPVRRGFSAPGAPRHNMAVLARPAAVMRAFAPGVPAFFCRCATALFPACGCPPFFVWPALPACRLPSVALVPGLQAACRFCAWPAPPGPARRLSAVRFVCAAFSSCFFAFFCLTFASQISFHLSLRPRRASTFFRKESRQRFAKGDRKSTRLNSSHPSSSRMPSSA